jgi:hypothetical protein
MADPLQVRGIPANLKSYVCIEVFEGSPVLYVSRPEGDWCFLCGCEHPDSAEAFRVVGIAHPVTSDPTLEEILDLGMNEEAERPRVGDGWVRSTI